MAKALILDFDGVLTNNQVLCGQHGEEFVLCNRSDSLGLKMLKEQGILVFVVSTETSPVVMARCQKLRVPFFAGAVDKLEPVKEFVRRWKLNRSQLVFVGNDVNDLVLKDYVGTFVAVLGSHPSVLDVADRVTSYFGGKGAVREVCDWILNGDL